jgi:hypothetical protein
MRAAEAHDRLQITTHVGAVKTLFKVRIEHCLICLTQGAVNKIAY